MDSDSDYCAAYQAAYQGTPGAFSEEAARSMLGVGTHLRPCRTLEDVFAALANGDVQSAVVPIENTLAGAVPGCADLIGRHHVRITADLVQPIVHALIGAPGAALSSIRLVWSHPVALAQCELFFRANPEITPVPRFDTAGSVADMMQCGESDVAAIAASRAADIHGAHVIADAIQDSTDNFTRFLLIEPGEAPTTLQADWKTSLLCVLKNVPGALLHALTPFAARGLSLSRIESRPLKDKPFEYQFHIDVAPALDAGVESLSEALTELGAVSQSCRILGHYPAAQRVNLRVNRG